MKRLTIFTFLAAFLLALPASATRIGVHYNRSLGTVLPEVALNAAEANRTFVIEGGEARGFAALILWVNYTHATSGTLSVTCTAGPSTADKDYQPTTCVTTDGICKLKLSGKAELENTSQSEKFWVRMGILGSHDMSCIAEHSAATANDKVEIKAELSTY